MTAWFEQFRHGDPANRDFQKRLIDTFVNAVYVFDDALSAKAGRQKTTASMKTASRQPIKRMLFL